MAAAVGGLLPGVDMMAWSSLDLRGSLKRGDGESCGVESDKDLFLDGVLDNPFESLNLSVILDTGRLVRLNGRVF